MLDPTEETVAAPGDSWRPRREPTDVELLSQAFTELTTRPAAAVEAVRDTVTDVSKTAARIGERAAGMLSAALAVARPPASSPLNVPIGEQRRFATVDLSLGDLKRVRGALGGTINDAVLAVIAGALRSWLQARGFAVGQGDLLKALLPISIAVPSVASGQPGGNRVSATLVELPVGEPDPAVRLQQISYHLAQLEEAGQFVGADAIVNIAGFGPPTLHALGARVGRRCPAGSTTSSSPTCPAPSARCTRPDPGWWPPTPCPADQNQALSIGLISYDGGVYFGLYADRDALPDLDLLVACLHKSRTSCSPAPSGRSARCARCAARPAAPKRKAQGRHERAGVRRPRRGLVLGGGGVLGGTWAVGALVAMEQEYGFAAADADVIVGTSAGSVLTALIGGGVTVDQLRQHYSDQVVTAGPLAGYDFDPRRPGQPPAGAAEVPRPGRPPDRLEPSPDRPAARDDRPVGLHAGGHPHPRAHRAPHRRRDPDGRVVPPSRRLGRRHGLRGRQARRLRTAGAPVAPLSSAVMASCAIPGWFAPGDDQRPHLRRRGRGLGDVDRRRRARGPRRGLRHRADGLLRDGQPVGRQRPARAPLARRGDEDGPPRGRDCPRAGVQVRMVGPGPEDLAAIGANLMDDTRPHVLETSLRTSGAAWRESESFPPRADPATQRASHSAPTVASFARYFSVCSAATLSTLPPTNGTLALKEPSLRATDPAPPGTG